MKKIRVSLGRNSYTIHIGTGLLAQTADRLKEIGFHDKIVVITDPKVRELYGNDLERSLVGNGFEGKRYHRDSACIYRGRVS